MPTGLVLVTPPAIEPVSLELAKLHLKVETDANDDDPLITGWVTGSRQECEQYTRRAFITQTWRATWDRWPADGVLLPPRPKFIAVTSLTYVDTAGVTTALTTADYQLDADSEPARICPAYGTTWPTNRGDLASIRLTYTAGYGATAASVPQSIIDAMKLLLTYRHEHRMAVSEGIKIEELPMAVKWLLDPYRVELYD